MIPLLLIMEIAFALMVLFNQIIFVKLVVEVVLGVTMPMTAKIVTILNIILLKIQSVFAMIISMMMELNVWLVKLDVYIATNQPAISVTLKTTGRKMKINVHVKSHIFKQIQFVKHVF